MTTQPADPTAVVDDYVDAWNITEPEERTRTVTTAWADVAAYRDPFLVADGHGEISDMHATFQASYPDHVVRRSSELDLHHDPGRFDWEILTPEGAVLVAGVDHVRFAEDGRLSTVTGFWGPTTAIVRDARAETVTVSS